MAVKLTDNLNEMLQLKGELHKQAKTENDRSDIPLAERNAKVEEILKDLQSVNRHVEEIEKAERNNNALESVVDPRSMLGSDGEFDLGNNASTQIRQTLRDRNKSAETLNFRHTPFRFDGTYDSLAIPVDGSCKKEYREDFLRYADTGHKSSKLVEASNALTADGANGEDYLLAPMTMLDQFLRDCDKLTFFRGLATIFQSRNLGPLGVRKRTKKTSSFAWGCVCEKPVCDTPGVGMKVLTPSPASMCTAVCRDLLRRTTFDVERFLAQELAQNQAEELEKAYFLGTGQEQPLGIMVASDSGISTSRDLETINALSVVSDDLISMFMNLSACVRQRANLAWIFPTSMIRAIMLLKDGEGQYLWRPGLQAGVPNTLIGRRVFETDAFTTNFAAGEYAGIIGDFADYWIAQGPQLRLERDVEPSTDMVTWYGRIYMDGMPIREQSFTRLKIKAA